MINQPVRNIILELASKKRQIVYGQQAINEQLPTHLKRKTKDYDILTKKPELAAKELADKLNKQNGNYKVVKAIYSRTWKVKDDKGETVADYTRPSRYPKTKTILGVKYADTSYAKRKIDKILKDEKAKYRWDKDKDILERIKKGEVMPW
jgi:hypothetical protein